MSVEIIHLKTQRNQPYGSERRCCERCGTMIWLGECPAYTDEQSVYDNPPEGYVSCNKAAAA